MKLNALSEMTERLSPKLKNIAKTATEKPISECLSAEGAEYIDRVIIAGENGAKKAQSVGTRQTGRKTFSERYSKFIKLKNQSLSDKAKTEWLMIDVLLRSGKKVSGEARFNNAEYTALKSAINEYQTTGSHFEILNSLVGIGKDNKNILSYNEIKIILDLTSGMKRGDQIKIIEFTKYCKEKMGKNGDYILGYVFSCPNEGYIEKIISSNNINEALNSVNKIIKIAEYNAERAERLKESRTLREYLSQGKYASASDLSEYNYRYRGMISGNYEGGKKR